MQYRMDGLGGLKCCPRQLFRSSLAVVRVVGFGRELTRTSRPLELASTWSDKSVKQIDLNE